MTDLEQIEARPLHSLSGTPVVCDLETAGLRPERHPIIQIAAIAVGKSLEVLETFEAKFQFDQRKADRRALRKNSYHPGLWAKEAQDPKAVAWTFADFLRRHASIEVISSRGETYRVAQLVAHNAAFDSAFLQTWYDKLGIFLPARRQVLCTMQRAMWFFAEQPHLSPPENFKLATLCRHFGVPFHAADAHEALNDVVATLGLYRALRGAGNSDEHHLAQRMNNVA